MNYVLISIGENINSNWKQNKDLDNEDLEMQ